MNPNVSKITSNTAKFIAQIEIEHFLLYDQNEMKILTGLCATLYDISPAIYASTQIVRNQREKSYRRPLNRAF